MTIFVKFWHFFKIRQFFQNLTVFFEFSIFLEMWQFLLEICQFLSCIWQFFWKFDHFLIISIKIWYFLLNFVNCFEKFKIIFKFDNFIQIRLFFPIFFKFDNFIFFLISKIFFTDPWLKFWPKKHKRAKNQHNYVSISVTKGQDNCLSLLRQFNNLLWSCLFLNKLV